ncbi:ABC transporter ATP-binding protein [Ningiella sp. W23]|uniref:ABC transporter ATP-binding protein n=1 Tax=Ningiella sp. W23 TaxID=3023715 RepID=UPI003756437B
MLKVRSLEKSYCLTQGQGELDNTIVLQDLNLELKAGSSMSIQGESGCGKSTLLHLIGALDTPDAGSILLHLDHVHAAQQTTHNKKPLEIHNMSESEADVFRRKHLGFVFQKFNLIDCISVKENIELPCKLNGIDDSSYVLQLTQELGIEQHLNKLPTQLSGGEQQRVAVARALAHKPSLVLADEPTGNLDEKNSALVSRLLFDSCKKLGISLIAVTHSAKVAELADAQYLIHNKKIAIKSNTEHTVI